MDSEKLVALVKSAQSGDPDALNTLFLAYYNEFYYQACIITKNDDLAKDITQDAFVEIMGTLDTLSDPSAFLLWGKKIIQRIARQYIEQQVQQYNPLPDDNTMEQIVEETVAINPSTKMDKAEFSGIVHSFLSKLPQNERYAVILHHFEDMPMEDIAKTQGISVEAAQSLLDHAELALRSSVQEYEAKNEMDMYGNTKNRLYDICISYAQKDFLLAKSLADCLLTTNLTVFTTPSETENSLESISRSKVFLPIITQNSISSAFCRQELDSMISHAIDRSKKLIVVCTPQDVLSQCNPALAQHPILTPTNTDANSINLLCQQIKNIIHGKKQENILFEKLTEYIQAGLDDRATEILCQLINELCVQISTENTKAKTASYLTLISYLEKMAQLYNYYYDVDSCELARQKLEALASVGALLNGKEFSGDDLYYTSIAIRLIYWDREIRLDCTDTIMEGNGQVVSIPEDGYAKKQEKYVILYQSQLPDIDKYPGDQQSFIKATEQYIYGKTQKPEVTRPTPSAASPEDELLQAIASFTREGNKLFDLISEKQPAREFLQCLLTSYERLKSYCDVVGAKDICAECIERISELKSKLIDADESTTATEKSDAGIKTLLGLTAPNSGKFDVFISHKSDDLDLAMEIYHFLRRNLKYPFLDKVSLPEMSKAAYSKAINHALDVSKHFVVVLSKLEHMNSSWISHEMSSFNTEILEERKQGGNFLIVVTNDLYDDIIAQNKKNIPYEYRGYEIIKMADYENRLLNYLNT